MNNGWQAYISINPEIRFGKPFITGTRITVGDVLGWFASGMNQAEIMEDFPELTQEQIVAALLFSAERENSIKILKAS